MTASPTPHPLTLRVAEAIRAARIRRGLSAPELASRCSALGVPIPANGINKIETAKRGSLKLEEAVALAYALDLPLVSLLVPLGDGPEVELLPNLRLPTWDAAKWITGEDARGEAPEGSPHAVLAMYRDFDVDVRTALISIREARVRREQAGRSLVGSQRYKQLTRQAAEFERIAHEDCERLLKIRERMRALGLCPAALPAELAFVAHEEEAPA